MIKNLLSFKIKINKLFFIFFGVMLGPYIKSRGTRATEMSETRVMTYLGNSGEESQGRGK